MIIRHLSIDCAYINKVLEPITQREHGVTEFEIETKNHGADIDLSECTLATYYGLKADEHKVGVECRVDKDKGLIYLPLYLQMTTAEGVLKGIVELQFPEGNVRFSGVNFKVSFAPDDTKIESTDDFNILENFISKPPTNGVVGQVLSIDNDGNTIWRTLKEFDGDYAHLSNRPSINGVELNGDKSLEDLNIKQTYTADDITFADGETFQQKFNNGELKGQDGVSGADGITPHIGDNGNWFIGETDTNKPSQGTNGVNGNDGVSVTQSEVNTSGELVITYSNGDSTNLGKIVGKDGLDGTNGQNGLSAYEIAKNGGFIGTEEDWLKSLKGEQGEKGQDGKTPVKGVDYFTAEDKLEFTAEVTENLKPELANQLSKLQDDIGDIPQILNSTVKSAGFEVLELEWMEGVIDSATGNVGKSKNNAITDFIPVSILGNNPIYITPQNGCKVYIYKYDVNKNYTGIVVNGATKEVVIIPDSPFYRFMIRKTDGTKFPISIANLCAVSGIKSGALTKKLNELASFTKPSFLLNTKNKIDVEDIFPLIKNYQINGNTGYEFASSKNVMISDYIPIKDSEGNLLVESVEFIFNGKSPAGNAVMFFYDKNKAYLNKQVIANVDSERMTVMLSNYPNANLVRLQYRLDILPSMKIYLNASSNFYEWLKIKRQQIVDDAKIDVGKNYYLVKGEPLELFRHGMIRKKYGNYSKPEGDYLISLNNSPGYIKDYVSKLVFNVPDTVTGNKLGIYEPFTSAPAFRLYDLDMKSLDYQYINIYMSDKTKIANKKRNICFFGDSLTAMGYISKHVKDKLKGYGLTNTKLVGVNTNLDDSENRFTATGGYSWDNYTKDPALLPSNLGNNHLWNPNTDDIDFNYFMQKYGNGETINYVVALIGWNDYDMRNTTWKDYATEGISAIERKARKFIGRLHEQYPNCHVLLVGYHVSTTAERNMHPSLPYESRNKFVWELNDLYKSFEDEFSFVHFIHTASQFDSYNNMRKQNTKPNIYAVNTIEMVTDDVHPAPEGYYQYGDAELRCLMYLMQNEN